MKNVGEPYRWLREAQEELETGRWCLKGERYAAACFWAQQSAEKALRAFLLSKTREVFFEHSISKLAEDCASLNEEFKNFVEKGLTLDKFYIPTRYPNGLPYPAVPSLSYTQEEAQSALHLAAEIIEVAEQKIEGV